jgi:hypothetical protein
MKKKNYKIILGIIGFLGIYILLAGYLSLTKVNSPLPKVEEKGVDQIIYATLEIGENKYQGEISDKTSVYDLMQKIQNNNENNFSFKYKEYPGMGVFVDEINGVKGTPGAYWIYYVNGKEASVGISNYIIKSGDIIRWKQK